MSETRPLLSRLVAAVKADLHRPFVETPAMRRLIPSQSARRALYGVVLAGLGAVVVIAALAAAYFASVAILVLTAQSFTINALTAFALALALAAFMLFCLRYFLAHAAALAGFLRRTR